MNQKEKEDILRILKDSQKAVLDDDIKTLRDLSNSLIESASANQDEDAITITVVIYSISKIFERTNYRKYKDWTLFRDTIIKSLKDAYLQLYNNHEEAYRKNIKEITSVIEKLSTNLKGYVQEVIQKAHITKGSRIYEHGISMGRVSQILGISKWELMDYVGRTGIPDVKENIDKPVKKRLQDAREVFS
jgi:hypothetical protein